MTPADPLLFPAADLAADSPRLAWLKRHGLTLWQSPADIVGATSPETGNEIAAWYCVDMRPQTKSAKSKTVFGGTTADEACANFATAHGLKLWNEEVTP